MHIQHILYGQHILGYPGSQIEIWTFLISQEISHFPAVREMPTDSLILSYVQLCVWS